MSVITFEKKFNQFINTLRSRTLSMSHTYDFPSISELYQKCCKYNHTNSTENSKADSNFLLMTNHFKSLGFNVEEKNSPVGLSLKDWFFPLLKEFDKENNKKAWYIKESRNKYIDKVFFTNVKGDGPDYYKHIGRILNELIKEPGYKSYITEERIIENLGKIAKNYKEKTVFSIFPLALIASEVKDSKIQLLLKNNAGDFFPKNQDNLFDKISHIHRQAVSWLRKDIKAGTLNEKTKEWFNSIDVSVPDNYEFYKQIEVTEGFKNAFEIPLNFLVFVVNYEEASNYKLEKRLNLQVSSQLQIFSTVSITMKKIYGDSIQNFTPNMGNYTDGDVKQFKKDMLVDFLTGNDYYFTCIDKELYDKYKEQKPLNQKMNDVAAYLLENNVLNDISINERVEICRKTFDFIEAKERKSHIHKVLTKSINNTSDNLNSPNVKDTFKL